jgi:hypothetical protein
MIYRGLADLVLILHLCFVLFVIFGGLVVLWKRTVIWLHLPAITWGILVELFQLPCPLTVLEKYFKESGGETVYTGGFIEHYISAILYPAITAQFQIFLGIVLIVFNIFIYSLIARKPRCVV